MAPSASRLTLIDPLTLLGRELLQLLAGERETVGEISYFHTADDGEHQIAELGGSPNLVPPLAAADDLAGGAVIVVTSDADSKRLDHLEDFLDQSPETPVIDAGRLQRLRDRTVPMARKPETRSSENHVRVAHPALVAATHVISPITHLHPASATVAAAEPVSFFGSNWVPVLARQATSRLQGEQVKETIDGHVLAFTTVALDGGGLTEDAAIVLPEIPIAVTRSLTGCFHGHVVHLGIAFREPVDERDIYDAWLGEPLLTVADLPVRLDAIAESDRILLAPPSLSPDRTHVAVTAMVDGLRLGGAVTAIDLVHTFLG